MCGGYAYQGGLKGPTGIVKCNRLWHDLANYEFHFRESNSTTGILAKVVRRAAGALVRVAPSERDTDRFGNLADDRVYQRRKKEAKDRLVFLSHYAPPYRTCAIKPLGNRTSLISTMMTRK